MSDGLPVGILKINGDRMNPATEETLAAILALGPGGGGTQYTEDAAAAANPIGTAVILVRQDTPAALTSTDGDNVAQRGTNFGAGYVQVVTSAGAFVDTFGGGVQYTEGDTDASITGTAMMWEDTGDTIRVVSAAKPLPVNIVAGSSSGTEYTQDAAAPANPTGGTLVGVRRDTPASIGANGDWIAVSMDEFGRMHTVGDISGSVEITDGGGSITIDATSLPLPTGAATSAKQDTIIGHLDGVEGLLTTIDADTGNIATSTGTIATSTSTLAGAVSGSEMQVDVITLPTATVQGVAAHGAAVSGNPVLLGGENPSGNVARLKTATDGELVVHQHSDAIVLGDGASNTMQIPVNQTDSGFMGMPSPGYYYNGTTWDRFRGSTADGLKVDLGANNDVTVTSSALPSGAATSAKQDTIIGHIDGLESTANSIKTNTDSLVVLGNGTEATALRVTIANDSSGVISVDDNGGSLTVDNTTLSVVGGGTEAAALRVTIASDSTGVLSIDDNGGSITVDGTITEANSAAMAASLSVLDDWDEANRAAVNLIAGQVGIAGGSGTVSALTVRAVLATDVGLPGGTNALGKVGHDISGIAHGVKTVGTAGTDEALATSTPCKKVAIYAQSDNTGQIAFGASGVDATLATGTGYYLYPGDGYEMEIDNLADVFIDATVSGDGVRYTYWT